MTVKEAFEMTDEAMYMLIAGILEQAIYDYKKAYKALHNPKLNEAAKTRSKWKFEECERFFRSDWCDLLSGGNGEVILKRVQKECRKDM